MTELETHLLNALEQLQQDYMQRLNEWESAFVELQKMFSLTQRDNAMLNERVMQLSRKRLTRTVLIFTESSDQLSRATDRVPGLPASPGYVQ
ncbi:MbeD family mobilization/exclusion protein [Escherichia coli]|nr:MbeD family mobilization/exclusion protein [Escherichia coli]MCJ1082667.1 MbeD family mobilization/exclusion protein [Escherichia coli]